MNIKKIVNYLEGKYPLAKAEKWDACGLIYGESKKIIEKVMVALDLTTEVFNQALEKDADLIVVHHPFVFDKENLKEELELFEYKKALINRIENTGIGVYVMHTNFDFATKGMKQATIDLLGLPSTGEKLSHGVLVEANMDIVDLKNLVRKKYGFNQWITNAPSDWQIKKLAILPGTGSLGDMLKAKKYGADLILTADIKWSTWISLKEAKMYALQIHHQMEKVMITKVVKDLESLGGFQVTKHIEKVIK